MKEGERLVQDSGEVFDYALLYDPHRNSSRSRSAKTHQGVEEPKREGRLGEHAEGARILLIVWRRNGCELDGIQNRDVTYLDGGRLYN